VVDLFGTVPPHSSARRRGYLHGILNSLALLLFIAEAALRGNGATPADNLTLLLSAIGVATIFVSGWLGGTLVYRNQIGVDHRYANSGKYKQRTIASWNDPVMNQAELAEGQMMLAEVAGKRIVLGRCGAGVFAFADRCTHKGGPLSDGALVGCAVQCPWHGSQFDVTTGRVVAGPAEHKIETYETVIRNGEVYVKQPDVTDLKKAA
jgi:nitrite reductase/ring-hydroxylating ferredoxin subunit